ncbi:MAG: lipopolysaccharide heptosyltransferase family protein [Ignavibacteria bacterium]|nr:lipopolysaccharide heptosyltransferase family protein [Ignavibacteria bacterium]
MTTKRKKTGKPAGKGFPAFAIPDCKHFTGYRPCFPDSKCYRECADPDPRGKRILIINLDAMGNVLVTTSILAPIKRMFPRSHISWLTLKNAAPLLAHNSNLDRVYVWEPESWLVLQQMKFDIVMNVDKSIRSGAFTNSVSGATKLGFGIDKDGVIVPLNREAHENYILGLDDHLKFRVNTKPVARILCETFRLDYRGDEYVLKLSAEEEAFCRNWKEENRIDPKTVVVGLNTGCSDLYPNKKLRIDQLVDLVGRLSKIPHLRIVLAGGPEDTVRNAEIARQVGPAAISTPTTEGLRRGLCYLNVCDMVISGDSFGMHAAIGLGKHVIAWFGVTSATEVNLFDRGLKLVPEGLECSPCWKKHCPYGLECIEMVDLQKIVSEVERKARENKG